MKSYSTYLFDVGGTLITFNSDARARAYVERAARVGVVVPYRDARAILDALDLEIPERQKGLALSLLPYDTQRAFWLELWAEGFRRLGVDAAHSYALANELLDSANGANFQAVYADVVPTLEALRRRGKGLGIVSNFSANCEALLRDLGLADYFDFFIVSGIVGIEKPDARIFHAAIQAAGRDARELVYVGDSIFYDVEGARGAGLDAVLVDRANRYPDFPGARVTSLAQLLD